MKVKDILPKKNKVEQVAEVAPVTPEIKGSRYAFYGSLRRGQYNHSRTGLTTKAAFLKTVVIPGFKMYSLGAFPLIVKSTSDKDKITVDLFAIQDESLERSIHMMEIGAGYERITQNIEGVDYYLYAYDRANPNLQQVVNGDWAEYQVELQKKMKLTW